MTHPAARPKTCPVCGGASLRKVFAADAAHDEVRCPDCGLFFYVPLPTPEEQKAFYDGQWADGASEYHALFDNTALEAENLRFSFEPRLELFAARGYSGRILDVGCSVGTFLKAAKARGWDVHGLDLGEEACARTAAAVGCPVHCATLETLDRPDGSFDVIHASQVIEHVLDPAAFLAAARRLLRPGGALLVATPIIEPAVYRLTHFWQAPLIPRISGGRERAYPWAVHHPFHVYVHSSKSLRLLMEKAGFDIAHEKVVPWQSFAGMNAKWRAFYHLMNILFHLTGTGMNIDILAVKS